MPKGIPFTKNERHDRRLEIAHVAAELIFEKGFNKTSVSQIARAAGIGKSTFYDFFVNKDELILLLLEEPLVEIKNQAEVICLKEESVVKRLYDVMQMHLEVLMRDKAFIFKLSFEFIRLPADIKAKHQVKQKEYRELVIQLIEEGIADGSIRSINAVIAMETLLSLLQSVLLASKPDAPPGEILNEALDLVMKGMLQD